MLRVFWSQKSGFHVWWNFKWGLKIILKKGGNFGLSSFWMSCNSAIAWDCQRYFKGRSTLTQLEKLADVISDNVYNLALCQHGNYVVQLIAEKGTPFHKEKIYGCVKEHFVQFCSNKFGRFRIFLNESNVAEKCVKNSDSLYKVQLIERTSIKKENDSE